jgi:thiamine pyrophosphate-dependent acetolactate synthase large subunit-like protein
VLKWVCKREVVAVIGDGGFQMTIQELGTIFQTKYQLKVILNNEFFRYGASMATVIFLISDMLLLR